MSGHRRRRLRSANQSSMVERVERLRANREVEPFPNLEVLEQVQVHVEVVRPTILVACLPRKRREWSRIRTVGGRISITKEAVESIDYAAIIRQSCRIETAGLAQPVVARIAGTAAAGLHIADHRSRNIGGALEGRPAQVPVQNGVRQPVRQKALPENCQPFTTHFRAPV